MYFLLENQVEFPAVGLGTYRLQGEECERVVAMALEAGYRAIDTAAVYRNEDAIGRALQTALATGSLESRQDVFITSKLGTPLYLSGH
jgi:2,5-diketo-D-gluconate reductase A